MHGSTTIRTDCWTFTSSRPPQPNAYKPSKPLRSALYRNNGDGTFTDVTDKVTWAERTLWTRGRRRRFDNDGFPDLYVTGYGRAILYHNNGDGTFSDVTAKAGVADEGAWSTSAGWFDFDKDGYLDLVVTNYLDWSPTNNIWCGERKPGLSFLLQSKQLSRPKDKALSQQPRRNFYRRKR